MTLLPLFLLLGVALVGSAQETETAEMAEMAETASLLVAAGCFWCAEQAFEQYAPGVVEATSGYAGGSNENPTYRNHVSTQFLEGAFRSIHSLFFVSRLSSPAAPLPPDIIPRSPSSAITK